MREVICRDAGIDCDAKLQGENDDEVLKKAEEHGREKHGMLEMTSELKEKVKALIHDVPAGLKSIDAA